MMDSESLHLQVGGALDPERHVYIERPADDELFQLLLEGESVSVLAPHNTGKSSLMARTAQRLQANGAAVAIVRLSELATITEPAPWYQSLLQNIAQELEIELDAAQWWSAAAEETPDEKLLAFLRDVVAGQRQSLAVVFFDQMEWTLHLPFTENLYTALRTLDKDSPFVEAYDNVACCVLGVVTVRELLRDQEITAYAFGHTLDLRDLDPERDDFSAVRRVLHDDPATAERLLKTILEWTGGQPQLTMQLAALARTEHDLEDPSEHVSELIEENYPNLNAVAANPHFQAIADFVGERVLDTMSTLRLYESLLLGHDERDRGTVPNVQLKLSGLVRRRADGGLELRNPLYKKLFNAEWAAARKPKAIVGDYEIVARVAQTPRGAIYRGRHRETSRAAALKHIRAGVMDNPSLEVLIRDVRHLTALDHPAVVGFHEILTTQDDGVWISMDWVEGASLRHVLLRQTLSLDRALKLALTITDGLAAGHRHGVRHRDLRAENIRMTEAGTPMVLDFGLARQHIDSRDLLLTQTGLFANARTLAPEQVNGLATDLRADLFSLGSLLYEMLTGLHPFAGNSFLEIMAHLCNSRQESVKVVNPKVPAKLSILVDQLLEKNPAARPQNAGKVTEALAELLGMNAAEALQSLREEHRPTPQSSPLGKETSDGNVDPASFTSIVGRRIDAYRIEEQIGRGGLGEVYRAWDEHLERPVAVKRLRKPNARRASTSPSPVPSPEALEREADVWREARTVAGISHASVVRILDIVETEDNDWLVMEYLEGLTLRELLERGRLELDDAMTIARDIAAGLSEVHAHGIVHQDLKASNVMVTSAPDKITANQTKILDFGLAERISKSLGPPHGRPAVTTIRAMSPEQATGKPIDQRSDFFSLGILFYEMVTGQHPFDAPGLFQPLLDTQRKQQVPADMLNKEVPEELSVLIDCLLAKNPEHRPVDGKAIVRILDKVKHKLHSLEADTMVSEEVGDILDGSHPPEVPAQRPQRQRSASLLIAIFPVLLLIGLFYIIRPRDTTTLDLTEVVPPPGATYAQNVSALAAALPERLVLRNGQIEPFEITLRNPSPPSDRLGRVGGRRLQPAGRYDLVYQGQDDQNWTLKVHIEKISDSRYLVTVEDVLEPAP